MVKRMVCSILARAAWSAGLCISAGAALAQPAAPGTRCGEVVTLPSHEGSQTRLAWLPPAPSPGASAAPPITLLLLAGGSGHVDLDAQGCPQALKGNSLIRSIPHFSALGLGTALLDAPSDHHGDDGLAGFRATPAHAEDLGRVISHLRERTGGSVWVVGTSRGSISAANAAARLSGPAAPDGAVITSVLSSGQVGARKAWVMQTVFDLPLEQIRLPLLIVGHAADVCPRSPPSAMPRVAAETRSERLQVVTVSGGPAYAGGPTLNACEGRAPHGFVEQEGEVAAGVARFVRGGSYER